jgi:hypothetical protein
MDTLKVIQGNSIGRSCQRINADNKREQIRIAICFLFIFLIPYPEHVPAFPIVRRPLMDKTVMTIGPTTSTL